MVWNIESSKVERLTASIGSYLDRMHASTLLDLLKNYTDIGRGATLVTFIKTYPINKQAFLYDERKGNIIALGWPDHPYLNDFQCLHALAHLLMGKPFQDNPAHPSSLLQCTDQYESDVSLFAVMLLITWESVAPLQVTHSINGINSVTDTRRMQPVRTIPHFELHHITALLNYFNARLAKSLPHTPRRFIVRCMLGSWPRLSTMPLPTLLKMTDELRLGHDDEWDTLIATMTMMRDKVM